MKNRVLSFALVVCMLLVPLNAYAVSEVPINSAATIEARIEEYAGQLVDQYGVGAVVEKCWFINDVYVCLVITHDGTIQYAYDLNGCIITKTIDANGNTISRVSSENNVVERFVPADKLLALDRLLSVDNGIEGSLRRDASIEALGFRCVLLDGVKTYEYVGDNTTSRASTYNVGMNELRSAFPALNNSLVYSKSFHCSFLNTTKTVYVRDTRNNYTQTSTLSGTFEAGVAIVTAAVAIKASPASIKGWLNLANTILNFPFDAIINRASGARASYYRGAQVYDTTSANAYVTCTYRSGYDYYTVTKQSGDYNYAWGLNASPLCVAERYPSNTVADDGAAIYNNALNTYGYWMG